MCLVFTAVYVQSKMSEKRLKRYSERDGDDDSRKRPAITGSDSDSFKSRTDEAIAAQKERAIQYWNESNYSEALKGEVHDDVMRISTKERCYPFFIRCAVLQKSVFLNRNGVVSVECGGCKVGCDSTFSGESHHGRMQV